MLTEHVDCEEPMTTLSANNFLPTTRIPFVTPFVLRMEAGEIVQSVSWLGCPMMQVLLGVKNEAVCKQLA